MPDTPFPEINPDPGAPNLDWRDQTKNADQRQVATAPEITVKAVVFGDLMIAGLTPPDDSGRMPQIERMRTRTGRTCRREDEKRGPGVLL